MPTNPYVTTASFTAHPTYLDLNNLRSGDALAADQTAQLRDLLSKASAWADSYVDLGAETAAGLGAHTATEQVRLRADRNGRLAFHASHIPVISVTSLAYGSSIGTLTTYTSPTVWIEDGRQIITELGAGTSTWSGSLQFGAPAGGNLFTRWVYVAGYVNTLLAADRTAGETSITVTDGTGIAAGAVLRICEPGAEEFVTVSNAYVTGSTTVPLTAGLTFDHDATTTPCGVSTLPADVHLAVVLYTTALLMRPDTTAEDAFPDARIGPSTRKTDARQDGSGLVGEAKRLLRSYRRVR